MALLVMNQKSSVQHTPSAEFSGLLSRYQFPFHIIQLSHVMVKHQYQFRISAMPSSVPQ